MLKRLSRIELAAQRAAELTQLDEEQVGFRLRPRQRQQQAERGESPDDRAGGKRQRCGKFHQIGGDDRAERSAARRAGEVG